MDQDLLQRAYAEINDNCCAYEKATLSRYCDCALAERLCIAEREGISCSSDISRDRCLEFLGLLRYKARFLLKNIPPNVAIPQAKVLKIQVGGLRGLQAVLNLEAVPSGIIKDTNELLITATTQFGTLDNLPFDILIQHIAAFEGRPRHHRRGLT